MDNNKTIFKYCGLLFACTVFLGGCGNFNSHMNEMLNEYVCERDAQYKVSPDREVIFFVKHHIIVGDSEPGTDQWDATGFTRTPKERIPWQSNRFALYRTQTIPALMQGVNEILYDNETNISLVSKGVEIQADTSFFPADFDLLSNPQGHTREVMEALVAKDPGYIHVFYGWTSSTAVIAAGEHFAVIVADDPRYGNRITSRALAREIINALGYQPIVDNDDENNLLHYAATGDSMSDDQVYALWDVVNAEDRSLKSISCEPELEKVE